MKILHYSLGLPPYSRGGLTKYVVDLILEQHRSGSSVAVLWPGRITFSGGQRIKQSTSFNGIETYEIINPLPLPQIYGIKDFEQYTKKGNKIVFAGFFKRNKT